MGSLFTIESNEMELTKSDKYRVRLTRLVLKGLVCEISTNIRVKRRGFPGTVKFEREK